MYEFETDLKRKVRFLVFIFRLYPDSFLNYKSLIMPQRAEKNFARISLRN